MTRLTREQIKEFARRFAESMKEPLHIGPDRRRILSEALVKALDEFRDRPGILDYADLG